MNYGEAKRRGLLSSYADRPLKAHPRAMAFVSKSNFGEVKLRSYATDICFIDRNGYISFTENAFLHSQTTTRHITWFLEQYAPNVSTAMARIAARDKISVNIYTLEVSERWVYSA